jgi:site-specific DNA-methyltransferase (adenine-specific)
MADNLYNSIYNPDVLSCLANLSNDEVFTPPEIANKMLDLLPKELWSDPNATFLDPACKSGVFLREIAKRLIEGLKDKIPDLQTRIDHIFHNQLYAIAITEMTSLLARRSVYCTKYPNTVYSVSRFESPAGNIRYQNVAHVFRDGKCIFCGASEKTFGDKARSGLERHAYEFIHTTKLEEIFGMKFDVIIGNPPYQLDDGGYQASSKPIYQCFIKQAEMLKPRFLCMIIPSRWMTGGKNLDEFRNEMIADTRLKYLCDYSDAKECFPGTEIKGGVCYFLWERDYAGQCEIVRKNGDQIETTTRYLKEPGVDVFVRDSRLLPILKKVLAYKKKSFSNYVSPLRPYGLRGDTFKDPTKYALPKMSENPIPGGITIWGLDTHLHRVKRYVPSDYPFPKKETIDQYKIFVTRNYGNGDFGEIPASPILAGPGEACTETFIYVGGFSTAEERNYCFSYMKTKFFRLMVSVKKQDQNASQGIYKYVPIVPFNKLWTDSELFTIFGLSDEEISFVESAVPEWTQKGE